MSSLLRREVPFAVAFVTILVLFADYYIKDATLAAGAKIIQEWAIIITSVMVGIGVINAVMHVGNRVKGKGRYWPLDLWMIIVMVIVVVTGFIGGFGVHPVFRWAMQNVYVPMDLATDTLVAFDFIAVLYRVFRIRSREGAILLLCAFASLIRNSPIIGGLWPQALPFVSWMWNVPTVAGTRAFQIVTAIGLMAFAIRVMRGQERGTIGVVD